MFQRLTDLFRNATGPANTGTEAFDETQRAAAALMVEAARMDNEFDAQEREVIARLLGRRFELAPERTEALIADAEAVVDDNAELYRLTRTLKDAFEHDDRVALMQMLWEVAYADGELHSFEANMMRRLAGLIYVSDRESGEARKRARARLGLADQPEPEG